MARKKRKSSVAVVAEEQVPASRSRSNMGVIGGILLVVVLLVMGIVLSRSEYTTSTTIAAQSISAGWANRVDYAQVASLVLISIGAISLMYLVVAFFMGWKPFGSNESGVDEDEVKAYLMQTQPGLNLDAAENNLGAYRREMAKDLEAGETDNPLFDPNYDASEINELNFKRMIENVTPEMQEAKRIQSEWNTELNRIVNSSSNKLSKSIQKAKLKKKLKKNYSGFEFRKDFTVVPK